MQAKVRDVMFKVATTVVCLLAYGMSSRLERVTVRPSYYYDPQEDLYGLAVKTISRSGMWSSDKTKALNVLLSDAPDGYYHSIISIVKNHVLKVYGDLDAPLFKAADVADLVEYGEGNVWNLVRLCEEDEHMILPLVSAGQKRQATFITETGLYNILAQSRKPLARAWRRVVHEELIALRRSQSKNISEKFEEWDHLADNIYFDEERGCLMRSVTVQGGDVEQVPYEP